MSMLILSNFITFFDAVKFVPLSVIIISGYPLLDRKRLIEIKPLSVSRLWQTSKCTAWVTKHVKMQIYIFFQACEHWQQYRKVQNNLILHL